ncbi:MAG: ATP-dependent DNA helicase, partial [Aggregatilineales bacterium]
EKALNLPHKLLKEIVTMGQNFEWSALHFFEAALNEKSADAGGEATLFTGLPYTPIDNAPAPDTEQPPADDNYIDAVLGEDGQLAKTLEHYEHRPQQATMAHQIAGVFREKSHLMMEAGTGTGKSLAYLLPAVKWAVEGNTRVVVATNTINLQEQLIQQDIPLLKSLIDDDFRVTTMKGRRQYLCPRRVAAMQRRQPTELNDMLALVKLLIWLQGDGSGDKSDINLRMGEFSVWDRLSAADEDCTTQRCSVEMKGICPYHIAKQRAQDAHLIITNHALLVADAATENQVLPDYQYLIVDEAHHLENAITSSQTMRVNRVALANRLQEYGGINRGIMGDFLKQARNKIPDKRYVRLETFIQNTEEVIKTMLAHIKHTFGIIDEISENSRSGFRIRITNSIRGKSDFQLLQEAWSQLSQFFEVLADSLENLGTAIQKLKKYEIYAFNDHLHSMNSAAAYLRETYTLLDGAIRNPDAGTIYWINLSNNTDYTSIQSAPLRVGTLMEQYLWQQKQSVVLTGATLQTAGNFDHITTRLYADGAERIALESPFNYRDSTLLYLPDDMPDPGQRNQFQKAVERGIIALAGALEGRTMVLFTSYKQLKETADNITPYLALGDISVFDQATGGNRMTLLENFKSTEKAVLLGTRSFWQGIDIPGDDLSALVIVRLPFMVPSDPIFASRSETYSDGFQEYGVPEAIVQFRQGFGRLIRSKKDRGIVTVFDNRIVKRNYGMRFLDSLPDVESRTGSLDGLAQAAKDWLNIDSDTQ